jgi:hypothetical protein
MNNPITTQSLQNLITFPFQDEKWKEKFLFGSLFAFLTLILMPTIILPLIPVTLLMGYFGRLLRGVVLEGRQPYLPEWDLWEDLFKDGFRLLGAGLIFGSPGIFLVLLGIGTIYLLPIVSGFIANEESSIFILVLIASQFAAMVLMGFGMLWGMFVNFFYPAAAAHLLVEDQFAAAFRISEWWAILRANLFGFLLAFLLMVGASMVVGFVINIFYMTIVLCCLIPIIVSPLNFYLTVFTGALFGQVYRDGAQELVEQTQN